MELSGLVAASNDLKQRFEARAIAEGIPFKRIARAHLDYRYEFEVEIPGSAEVRTAKVFWSARHPDSPVTRIFGPEPVCRRHRNRSDTDWLVDLSLCLWFPQDEPEERWTIDGGLGQLRDLATIHAFCEWRCSLGEDWPKREAVAPHPRPVGCKACPR